MARKVPKSFREMKTEHLACRNFTHPWEPVESEVTVVERKKAWVIRLFCARCGGTCKEIYFPTSRDRKRTGISYPDGYLVQGLKKGWGGRKLLNENVRHEYFDRIVNNGAGRRKPRARSNRRG